jgi:hypothetical protein
MKKCKLKKSWIDIELEHTKNRKVAKKIAQDHVNELGCGYYPSLIKMEKKLKKR